MRTADENAEMQALATLLANSRRCAFCDTLPATVGVNVTGMPIYELRCDACSIERYGCKVASDLPVARLARRLYALLKGET